MIRLLAWMVLMFRLLATLGRLGGVESQFWVWFCGPLRGSRGVCEVPGLHRYQVGASGGVG